MLDERKREILRAIIEDYISDAEPIGSRSVAKKHDLKISPATIRNEMADLEVLGYLEQPHTSAGRVPSAKGYRFYVDYLMAPKQMSKKDILDISNWYQSKAKRVEEVFQETAKILSTTTNNISMVLAPQLSKCFFKYLQFLPLDEKRSIVVIVTNEGLVENKVVEIPEGLMYDDLHRIANCINTKLSGISIDRIKSSLLTEIQQDILRDPILFETALQVLQQVLATDDKKRRLYLGGAKEALNQPEFRDVEKIKKLLTLLEEETLLRDILYMDKTDKVSVTIGQESHFTGVNNCSVVKATYRLDGQIVGSIAVLGPTRMEYGKVMTTLDFMCCHLSEILSKYKLGKL